MLKNRKLVVCLICLVMIFGSVSMFAVAQGKTLRVQVLWGPVQYNDIMKPWVEDFNDSQKGNIQLKVFTIGELASMEEMTPAVQRGTIDIAQCLGSFMAAPIDVVDLSSAPPFAWNSALELLTLWEIKGMKEIVSESWEALGGIKVIGHTICDPLNLVTTKPIKSIEDLKGLKISADANVARIFALAGATSVFLPFDDLYLSAETGVIDGIAWGGATECYSNSWYEVCPYFLTNPISGAFTNPWIMNEKAWNSLSLGEQKALKIGLGDLRGRATAYYYNGESESLKYFKTTTLPAKDWNLLRQYAMQYWDEVIAPKSERAAQLVKILKDYNEEVEANSYWR